jgi:predicted Rossmann fold nucleotide-binding protein DprA/Smf involved in DNA uptake
VASLLALVPRGRGRTDGGEVAPGTCAASSASSFERKVLDVLRAGPRLTDELAGAASMAPRDVLVALASLELLGLARVEPSGLVVAL